MSGGVVSQTTLLPLPSARSAMIWTGARSAHGGRPMMPHVRLICRLLVPGRPSATTMNPACVGQS